MKDYYGIAHNNDYRVGCAGQTVYVTDGQGAEIARLKDVPYAYAAAFSPDGSLLVVRSTTPRIAFYAPSDFRLVQKTRMRRPNSQPQDEGFCFSPDGKLFWSLEYQNDLTTHLVSYDIGTFAETDRFFEGERYVFSHIEPNIDGGYDLLGFRREPGEGDNSHWLARFNGKKIIKQTPLTCSVLSARFDAEKDRTLWLHRTNPCDLEIAREADLVSSARGALRDARKRINKSPVTLIRTGLFSCENRNKRGNVFCCLERAVQRFVFPNNRRRTSKQARNGFCHSPAP